MIFVKKLTRPMKKSGYELKEGQTTEVRGLIITNKNKFSVYVDKFSGYRKKEKK